MKTDIIGVMGSGVMGGGIAQMFAEKGFTVLLRDIEQEVASKGLKNIEKRLMKSVEKGKIDAAAAEATLGRVKLTRDIDEMAEADVVFEAVVEEMNVKSELFRKIEDVVPPETVIGTNTSSLSVEEMSRNFRNPERFMGIHFFNPPTKLELVELVVHGNTSAEAEGKIKDLLEKTGKTIVNVKDSPGFIVNRLLLPMINEAAKLLEDGVADAGAIDAAMRLGALHPVGPLELADLIGLDVCKKILERMEDRLADDFYKPTNAINDRVEAGRLGRKTGGGFYEY